LAAIAAVGVCFGAEAQPQATLPKNSPFMPPAGSGQAAAAATGENIEFAGVSAVGKRTDLVFYDKAAKKSRWIGIGETKDGIELLRYDSRREQAVIRHNGVEKILNLRKGSAVSGGAPTSPGMPGTAPLPSPAMVAPPANPLVFSTPTPPATTPDKNTPAGAKPPPPPLPEGQQKQEMEARMLVSDLLEIGMAQRRAYEEAQRKAAEAAPAAPPADAPKQP
jgi:hypothetical protein